MAFGARKVFPNDLRPRVAIGFNLPINGEAVFTPNYQTKDAIKNNLINFFLTNPGERPGNPSFGGGLREFIFTQIQTDNLEFLKEYDGKTYDELPRDLKRRIKTFAITIYIIGNSSRSSSSSSSVSSISIVLLSLL